MSASRPAPRHLRFSDLRSIAKLATQATNGVTHIVEGVHRSVLNTVGVPGVGEPGPIGGITGLVYKSIFGTTRILGKGVDAALASLEPYVASADDSVQASPQREAFLAALNGMIGDRLLASDNPLATPMRLYYEGATLNWDVLPEMPAATGKVLVLVHGLCVNEQCWRARRKGHAVDHGRALERELGYTPVYLRYNSGRHTSQNGQELALQLQQMVAHWPVPIEELSILAHSMGGLVARSACEAGRTSSSPWLGKLKHMIFLGTPHHGAPLERAGSWVDEILGKTPYTAPFATLGRLRSAGITDLRHGNVVDADWQIHDRFVRRPDRRRLLPLPEGVRCHTVAATTAFKRNKLAERLIGDGLVSLPSALGQHDDPRRKLAFARSAQHVVFRMHHMDLLNHPDVSAKIVQWLAPRAPG